MKILVTGGCGFIGSHLVDRLVKENDVIVFDKQKPIFRNRKAKYIFGDMRNVSDMQKALEQIETVFHLAALIDVGDSFSNPIKYVDNNILGTINILKHCHCPFVFVSSAAVYGAPSNLPLKENMPLVPISPYGVSKVAGEYFTRIYAHQNNFPFIIARPFNVYGPRQDPKSPYSGVISKFICHKKQNKSLIIFGDGKQTRDFIHVYDVVSFLSSLTEGGLPNETFNVATGVETSINELALLISNDIEHIESRKGDIFRSVADTSKAKSMLKWEPTIKLKDGIKELM